MRKSPGSARNCTMARTPDPANSKRPEPPHAIEVLRFDPTDRRLGRHVAHDSRSRRFSVRPRAIEELRSVRHEIGIDVLNQGELGSCTGNAAVHALASNPFVDTLSPHFFDAPQDSAIQLYSAATKLDPWPGEWTPDDTGSNGLSVAKAMQDRGLIAGYRHALGLEACLTALASSVVMIGTTWRGGMYDVSSTGRIRPTGAAQGGHEYVLDELDVERQRVWMRNSWGASWGVQGRAWLSFADLAALLDDFGDVTVLVPKTQEPPKPEPVPVDRKEAALRAALATILDNVSCPKYLVEAARDWMAEP